MKSDNNSKQIRYNNTTFTLIVLQIWRIVGLFFLFGVSQEIIHPFAGIPAGVGDILVGVTAIPLALFLKTRHRWSKRILVIWNVLGIVDLVNAVMLGILDERITGTLIMQKLPWVLYPTVAVPLGITLNVIILNRLRHYNIHPS